MIEYPKVQHKIPKIFQEKIELDHFWLDFFQQSVIRVIDYKRLRGRMLVCRDRCGDFIQRQRGGTGGATG